MKLIQTVSVGAGGTSNITFGSIPDTFTDLVILMSSRSANSGDSVDSLNIRFNGSSSTYSFKNLYSNGYNDLVRSNAETWSGSTSSNATTAGIFGQATFYIPNYTSALQKVTSTQSASEGDFYSRMGMFHVNWDGTSAINSIALTTVSGSNFMQYSSASLYGVLKGSGGATAS